MSEPDPPGASAPSPTDLPVAGEPARTGESFSRDDAIRALDASGDALTELLRRAGDLRDRSKGKRVSFSRKAFFPVTNLCRDRCAYCTFRRDENEPGAWTMSPAEIRSWAQRARDLDCREALLCLGDQPEAVFPGHRAFLREQGHTTTIEYVARASQIALEEGLLPHSNPGLMTLEDLALLRRCNVSLGLMLETTSSRLRGKGQVHFYAPDKDPERRLEVLRHAGQLRIPFTTGLLIGIGETHAERVDTLLAIADLHQQPGHVQEVIVQNFRAKPEIAMAASDEPDEIDLARTVAVARLLLGPEMNVQIPPNLSPSGVKLLLQAGINDFGGISPLTPDYVNPEMPWPHLRALARSCADAGHELVERLAIYPEFIDRPGFLDPELVEPVRRAMQAITVRRIAA